MSNIRQACRLPAIVLAMCSGISASAIASASAGRPLISAMGMKPALQACAVLSVCATIDEMRLGPIVSFDVDAAGAHALVPFGWEFEPSIEPFECTAQATALVVWGSLPCTHAPTGELPRLGGTVKTVTHVACEQLMLLQLPSPVKVPTSRALVPASFLARPQRQEEQGMPQDRLRKALFHLMSIARKSLKLKSMHPDSPARKRFLIADFFSPEYEWCVVQEAGTGDDSSTPCTTDEQRFLLAAIILRCAVLWVIVQRMAGHFRFCLGKLCGLVLWYSGILRWLGRYLLTRQSTSVRELDEVCRTPNVKAALALTAEQADEGQAQTMVVYTFTHQPRLPHAQCQVLTVVRPDPIDVTTDNAGSRSTEFDIDKMIEKLDAALARRSRPFRRAQRFELGASEWQEYNQAYINANELATLFQVDVVAKEDVCTTELVLRIP